MKLSVLWKSSGLVVFPESKQISFRKWQQIEVCVKLIISSRLTQCHLDCSKGNLPGALIFKPYFPAYQVRGF